MKRNIFRRRSRFRRRSLRIVALAVAAILAWLAGLIYFATTIPVRIAEPETTTDAIVVLTGGSARLEEGLRLLGEKKAKWLLISGVNPQVDLTQLLTSTGLPAALMPSQADIACCIFIGHRADNTAGNAREAAEWAAAHDLHSLRLVTADYHMPRSLLEFRRAMPGVAIIPHPVFPEEVKREEWWLWPGTASLLVNEYHKYLVVLARGWVTGLLTRLVGPSTP
ncbi:MAG TPA: YdcF family protein [Dongiaceae bacterium]|nr:YdcF family protein [Dongiaceae bacterium]